MAEHFSLQEMRRLARAIFFQALSAVDPSKRMKEVLRLEGSVLIVQLPGGGQRAFDLKDFHRVFLVGTGKAASAMAQAVEEVLGERLTQGIITTKYGHGLPLRKTELIEAGHPIPDEKGLEGAKKIQRLLEGSGPDDLVIFLLSGGGSALLPFPAGEIRLEEKQQLTELLLACGADIKEINTLRKHISAVKGGWLAKWAYPSTMLNFILSDVVGDPLDVIASGPTVPDSSTFHEAWEILEKYDLTEKVAPAVRDHLLRGKRGEAQETPKLGERVFDKVYNILIGSNRIALQAAAQAASSYGFRTLILSSSIVGETREAALFHGAIAQEVIASGSPIERPACLLSGGETTVTLRGKGRGGRNQEFALAAALAIEGLQKVVILSGGTDGTDGPTDAAGAISDHTTVARAKALGMDPRVHLNENDAYPFFHRLNDLLITGPTQTNVMDVRILLVD